MKKLLIGLAVVVLLVGVATVAFGKKIYLAFASKEAKACAKIGELCGGEKGTAKELDQCEEGFKQLRKITGEKGVDKTLTCVDDATSCMAATGCVMGGVGVGALEEMMKGFGNAMSK